MPQPSRRPMVLLFDIGGVCVVSPLQAIRDYEQARGIPLGWVNHAISASGRDGAWQRLERGEVLLDDAWFRHFKADLTHQARWRLYYAKHLAASRKDQVSDAAEEAAYDAPPPPDIDAEWLYWEMMRISREPDKDMYPALKKLRAHADANPGALILGALSNTSIFPPDHPFNNDVSPDGLASKHLKGLFDVFVSSAHVGMRKPDEDIYRYALVRLHEFAKTKFGGDGVKADGVTFLDDIGANCRTARKLGMKTIKVDLGHVSKAVRALENVTGLRLRDETSRL